MDTKWDIMVFFLEYRFQSMESEGRRHLDSTKARKCFEGWRKYSTHSNLMKRRKMLNKSRISLILCLGDKVLREITREKIITNMWIKL